MMLRQKLGLILLTTFLLVGCESTEVMQQESLVSGAEPPQQISGVEQFRNRIIRDFGSWTNFNNAVSSGESIKARELYKQWEAMKLRDTRSGEGNPIINQMNMLIQNQ